MTSDARRHAAAGLLLAVAMHAALALWASGLPGGPGPSPATPAPEPAVWWLAPPPRPQPALAQAPTRPPPARALPAHPQAPPAAPAWVPQATPATALRPAASMDAPPPPSAEDWAFAAGYTLKNSKAYRHTWGQQIRSQMGTAVEGPDQGLVRFRVEIAPDGALVRLDTLWSTSAVAERLARRAILQLPRWAPTPTGRPLVFEKTIAFTPYAVDGPPIYRDDCNPDPPAFRNPYAWDGRAPPLARPPAPREDTEPQDPEDCRRQLPQDSIEAESARDRRALERWGSTSSAR